MELRLEYDGTAARSSSSGVGIPGQSALPGLNNVKKFTLVFDVAFFDLDIFGKLYVNMNRNEFINVARRMLAAAGELETQPAKDNQQ